MPRFSVIIPCFNCAGTIGQTITALQAQTCSDWEAICIDDGSSDTTLRVLNDHAETEPRLRVCAQDNTGPSRARNAAVNRARGEILAFLDADDVWTDHKLASVSEEFESDSETDAVFGRVAFFTRDDGANVTFSNLRPGAAHLRDFLGENPACTLSNMSVRRDVFLASGGFETSLRHSEDLEWSIRLLAQGGKITATPDMHVRYRASEDGLSSDLHAMHAGWRRAVRAAGNLVSQADLAACEAVHLRYLARRALRMGLPPRAALGFMIRGLALSPRAFLGGRHRGFATLVGCLIAPLLPARLRQKTFA